jgi:hypothetical protein
MMLKIACTCGHTGLVCAERLPAELRCWQCGDRRHVAPKDCARIRNRVAPSWSGFWARLGRSTRQAAADLDLDHTTVVRARKSGGSQEPPATVTGRDGGGFGRPLPDENLAGRAVHQRGPPFRNRKYFRTYCPSRAANGPPQTRQVIL